MKSLLAFLVWEPALQEWWTTLKPRLEYATLLVLSRKRP